MRTPSPPPSSSSRSLDRRSGTPDRRPALFLLSALVVLLTSSASATSWDVNPIRLTLTSKSESGALTFFNRAREPVVIQATVKRWTQEGGHDVYTPVDDLIVSPPIFEIGAGGSQVVRVGVRGATDISGDEHAYRIFFREVPPEDETTGVRLALQVAVPIFVSEHGRLGYGLAWSLWRDENNALMLACENVGEIHAQLAQLVVSDRELDRTLAVTERAAYVLPGQRAVWTLAEADPPIDIESTSIVRLRGESDRGPLDIELDVGRPGPIVRP